MTDEYDEVNHVPGLKTDLELLLTHFTNSKSVRYAEFAKIWRQMGFPTIFCGWGKEEVLREMIETALRLSVGFWNDMYTFQVRIFVNLGCCSNRSVVICLFPDPRRGFLNAVYITIYNWFIILGANGWFIPHVRFLLQSTAGPSAKNKANTISVGRR